MSTLSSDQKAPRKPTLRHSSQRPADGQRLRKKAISTSRNQNALSANPANLNRPKTASTSQSSSSANGQSSNGSVRQRSRAGTSKSGEQRARKSQPPIKPPKTQNNAKNSDHIAVDVDTLDVPEVSDHFLAAISKTTHLPKVKADAMQSYTAREILAAGPVFPDPSSLGFMKQQQTALPRPVPRYMLHQPRLLAAPPFHQTPWDKQNQEKMLSMEQGTSGTDFQGIYEEFQKMREIERKKMEELGLVDAENITKDLNDAIVFQGTCLDMCPTFERVRRSLENNVKHLEKDPATNRISRTRAVKAFSRPAAGQPPPIPSDVRPPFVLSQTLDYIVDEMVSQLPESHSFVWDRTRSIRQDFVYQNYYGPEAIDCNERIVRVHLLSLHIMAGSDMEYSQQQELEQLNKALQTLTEIYSDVRNHGGFSPNEAELRAYHLISHFRDPELEREAQGLPDKIYKSPEVQLALRFRLIMSQNNVVERGYTNKIGAVNLFVEFFRLAYSEETSLLLAFLLETHFNEIRFYALKSLSRAFHTKGKAFSAESLRQMLGFDTLSRLTDFVEYYEIDTFEENGELLVDLCNKEKLETKYKLHSMHDKPKRAPAYSPQLDIRLKRFSYKSLVNSGKSNADLHIKQKENDIGSVDSGLEKNASAFGKAGGSAMKGFGMNSSSMKSGSTPPISAFNSGSAPNVNSFGKPAVSAFGNTSNTSNTFNKTSIQPSAAAFGGAAAPSFDFTAGSKPETKAESVTKKSPFPQFDAALSATAKPDKPKKSEKPSPSPIPFSFGTNSQKSNNIPAGIEKPVEASKEASGMNNKSVGFKPGTNEKPLGFTPAVLDKQNEKTSAKNGAFENKNVLSFGSAEARTQAKPQLDFKTSQAENSKKAETPVLSRPKSLKDSPNYSKALSLVCGDIVQKVAENEVRKIAAQVAKYSSRAYERYSLIEALANELYSAFLSEQMHHVVLESMAQTHYSKLLKKSTVMKIKSVCKTALAKQQERSQRQNEVAQMTFKAPSLRKRQYGSSSDSSFSIPKRRFSSTASRENVSIDVSRTNIDTTLRANGTIDNMHQRQAQVQELWRPIELEKLVEFCEKGTRLKPENGSVLLDCILVAENWNSPYSKWLNTKFSLATSPDKTYYTHEAHFGELKVNFRSLPKANFVNEQSFRSTPFLVFECGLLDETQLGSYPTIEKKLSRDGGILSKIVQICDRFSYYKVQILVVAWDITNRDISVEQKRHLLNLEELVNLQNCVSSVTICDMASTAENNLQEKVFEMGRNFTGQLSKRGIAKRAEKKAAAISEPKPDAIVSDKNRATEALKAKEDAILEKAKNLHKRRYLSAHVTGNKSADLTNTSGVFRTPHTSFANHTLLNYNHSLLGNNTFLHARDASFMRSFANGSVLEESTPMGSPGPRPSQSRPVIKSENFAKIASLGKISRDGAEEQALPKKVQELRDITASIKARYKS